MSGDFGHRRNPFERAPQRVLLRRLTVGAVGLTLALSVAALANPAARRWVASPGTLSDVHAGLAQRCDACHAAADLPPSEWVGHAVAGDASNARCMECHDFGENAGRAHGVSASTIAAWSSRAVVGEGVSPLLAAAAELERWRAGGHPEIACASCHREHQGAEVDLTAVADSTCQACHTQQFESLAYGHPEFSDYGAEQAGRLRFTHAAHLGEHGHFAEEGRAAPDCRACHAPDSQGQHELLRANTFSRWCGECHSGREFEALELAALPPAPVAWLGIEGEWALAAEKDDALDPAAAQPKAFAQAVLSADATTGADALETLVERFQDYALDLINEDDAWDGRVSADMRLELFEPEEAAEREAEEQALLAPAKQYAESVRTLLAASADPELFEALLAELTGIERGPRTRAVAAAIPQAGEDALRHEGYGHEDPFLKAWIELSQELPVGSPRLDALRASVRGRCVSCHEIDEGADGVEVVWTAAYTRREQTATRFDHAAHQGLPGIASCTDCHQLEGQDPKLELDSELSDFRLARFGSRAVCASCHAPEEPAAAPSSCVSCHDYHVGAVPHATPTWAGDPAALVTKLAETTGEPR